MQVAAQVISFRDQTALALHSEAMTVAKQIKTEYLRLFEVLLIVEARQIYHEFDVTSLYVYCTELLELSKHVTKDFITVVRKSLEVPELTAAIRNGNVTIPKARKICSVLNQTNHKGWIDLAIHCSCRVVEKAVAMANPREAVSESLRYVSSDTLEFKFGVTEEWSELLTRTKDLLSQRNKRNVTSEEALFLLMTEFCRKHDPVEIAKRSASRKHKKEPSNQTAQAKPSESKPLTRYRPAIIHPRI